MTISKISKIEIKQYNKSGYIEDGWNTDSFIQYDNGVIAFDHYYNEASYKKLVRVIKKALALNKVLLVTKFKVINIKGTLRIVTDIHGSTI